MHAETDRLYHFQHSKVVDLCKTNAIKCIQCDTPCSEGYEVTNLTTSNFVNRCKGFLAERFIKPPINITLHFSSSVHIRYIVIHCKVGAQKTMGLELLSETHRTEGQFESIGSGVLPEDKIGFVFHRHNETVTNSSGGQYLYNTFRSSRHLSFVDRLKIKIFRTSGSSVPAIGKIEIWGNPCKSPQTNNRTVDTPINKYLSRSTSPKDVDCQQGTITVPESQGQSPHRPERTVQQSSCNPSLSSEKELQIPDEFIDPITCEIMLQPLIMPSGKIVDNSTLESYIKAEEKWGRGANDPFTGLLFTTVRKPLVASELKIRIDRFLSKNSDNIEFFGIPRIVGRGLSGSTDKICKPSISNLVSNASTSLPLLVNLNETLPNKNVGKNQSIAKRQKLEIGICNANISSAGSSNTFKNTTSRGRNLKTLSFQEMMDQSLEFSLKQTLAQLPKLTAAKVSADSEETVLECYICKLKNGLFSIPCKHYICRNCLIGSKTRDMCVCRLCKSEFKSCDVVKIHLPT